MKGSPGTTSSPDSLQGFLEKCVIFFLFLGIFLSSLHKLWSYDVWWHLKTGEWIFKYHRVPVTNLYSYAAADHPWIDLSWFFQLLLYLSYSLLGINGILLFKTAVVTGSFFVLFRSFYKKTDLLVLIPTLILTLFTVHERLVERPEILSYFFLLLSFSLLESDRAKPTKKLYFLPLVQFLWANSHALSILGLFAVSIESADQILSWFLSKKKAPFPGRISLVALCSFFSSLANPYGLTGFLFPLTLLAQISGKKDFTSEIREFRRPLGTPDAAATVILLKVFFLLTTVSFLRNRKNARVSSVLLFVSFAALALLARRNIALFAFTAAFLFLRNMQGVSFPFPSERIRSAASLCLLCVVLILPFPFLTNGYYRHERSGKQFGFGVTENRYPIDAARFVEKTNLQGNSFGSGLEIGDYFIWRFYPQRRVFVDGRLEAYEDSLFEKLFELLRRPSRWPEWAEAYDIHFCVLNHTHPKHTLLLTWLSHSPEWSAVYLDSTFVIFLKNRAEYRKVLDAYAIDFAKGPIPPISGGPEFELQLADFYGKMGLYDKAEFLYRKNRSYLSKRGESHNNFGNILFGQGKYKEALSEYERAISLQPDNALFHLNKGRLYLSWGQKEAACEALKKSAALSPSLGEGSFKFFCAGKFEKAPRTVQK